MLAFAARISKRANPRARVSPRTLRAEVTREGGGDGDGGGAALWWDTINHFKGFKSSNHPLEGERTSFPGPASLSSPRVPRSRATAWDVGRPDKSALSRLRDRPDL